MIYVITDRTLDIYLHLRYPVIFTRSLVAKILCALWVCALFIGTGFLILEVLYIKNLDITYTYATATYVVVDAILFAISALSFVYLFSKVRSILLEINQNLSRQSECTPVRKSLSKKLKIPLVILATYLVFNLTGDVFTYLKTKKRSGNQKELYQILDILAHVLWWFGLISDGVIYIFMQRNIRAYLKRLLTYYFRCHSRTTPTNDVSSEVDVSRKSVVREIPTIEQSI